MEKVPAVLILLLASSNALIRDKPNCPEAKSDDNFQLETFTDGIWYMFGRYPNESQDNDTCTIYENKVLDDNTRKFISIEIAENSPNYRELVITADDSSSSNGDIIMNIFYGKSVLSLKSKVLLYDSKKIAIIYSCNFDENIQMLREYAWIIVRSRKPDEDIVKAIDDFMESAKVIDANQLILFNSPNGICTE